MIPSTFFWLRRFQRLFLFFVISGLLILVLPRGLAAGQPGRPAVPASTNAADGFGPVVVASARHDLLPSLHDLPVQKGSQEEQLQLAPLALPKSGLTQATGGSADAPGQMPVEAQSTAAMPGPLLSFDGIRNQFGGWPPDTQGDIGRNYYVQWINLHFAIWQIDRLNQTASLVYGPTVGRTLFSGFGGVCEIENDGDPITLYDPFANRWFMSQFALPNFPSGPFYQCVAVSQTSDPTGAWYRYEFKMPGDKMNDYPKFGVWPDAYYMTINQFNGGSLSWGGAGVAALERQAMLTGSAARMVFFDLYAVNSVYGGMLPADFDGGIAPPAGAPGYFLEWDDGRWIGAQDALRLWEFHVDWANPANSTFGQSGDPDMILPTLEVDADLCSNSSCIPQPGTATRLDALSDRLMHRVQYRNMGTHEVLLTNHTVDVDSSDHAGVHWFELRRSGAAWSLFQDGVFAPDADNRWMGSIAMDHVGNIGLGYSVSSAATYPSVRYTGRLAGDPPGSMPQGEQSLVEGSGSQTGSGRWGDYSMMAVDPVDDCTFWYTQEYLSNTGFNTWKTRIGAFRFPNCTAGPSGMLEGRVLDRAASLGIAQARVDVALPAGSVLSTLTSAAGEYGISLPVGVYTVTASSFGYQPLTVTGIAITEDATAVQDFALQSAPRHTVSGAVYDAKTGWPLYARIVIGGAPLSPAWTDPATGRYSLSLPEGYPYTLSVQAFAAGYLPVSLAVGPLTGDLSQDFPLHVDVLTCKAPGYQLHPTTLVNYSFNFEKNDGGFSPQGFISWAWGVPSSGPMAAHSGSRVWATNLAGNYGSSENGHLAFPVLNLSALPDQLVLISWWQWLFTESGFDFAWLEVSKDAGASWQVVYGPVSGEVNLEWAKVTVAMDSSYATPGLRARFRFKSDYSYEKPGWYIDDVGVSLGQCVAPEGSLVVGNVYDQNTGLGLVGASVSSPSGASVTTAATPQDPALADGFYTLFLPRGVQALTASKVGGYQPVQVSLVVPRYRTLRQDFYLPAGRLVVTPGALVASLQLGDRGIMLLSLENQGSIPAAYAWRELDKGFAPSGPFEEPNFATKPFRSNFPTTAQLNLPTPPVAPPLAAGNVLRSWVPQGLSLPWGVVYDPTNESIWVSSPGSGWGGQDALFEYRPDGSPTGRSHPHTSPHTYGPADLAFNWNTGAYWAMNVNSGVANCIYEIDPELGYTGASICPGGGSGFSISQRGLAYDPSTDTWFAGGWNNLMIYRFDSSGTILSAVNVGLAISGLAYNPDTQHLFVMVNKDPNPVYVLDAANNYALVGQFYVSQGFAAYSGSGLEMDCDGNLWAVDQQTGWVVEFESGETANLCQRDVPWLSETPASYSLPGASTQIIQVALDASVSQVDQPGVYQARLKLIHDTPYLVPAVPVTMTVTAPPSWGQLAGAVTSLGYCDRESVLLSQAQVTIQSSSGVSWTVETDENGSYQRWLDSAGSPYLVTVDVPGYVQGQAAVVVTPGAAARADFALHWQQPCLAVDTAAISQTLKLGYSATVPVLLENTGHAAMDFRWLETAGGSVPSWLRSLASLAGAILRPASGASPDARLAPSEVGFAAPVYLPANVNILLNEGFEAGQMPPPGWSRVAKSATSWSTGNFAPHTGGYYAHVLWDYNQDEWLLSPEMELASGMLSFWSYGSLYWCRDVLNNCDLNVWIVVGQVGGGDDIFVGRADQDWQGSWTWSQSAYDLTPLLPGGVVRIGFQYLGSDGAEITLDDIALNGLAVSDVPWLSAAPAQGSVPAVSGSQVIEVKLAAGVPELTQPGRYTAWLYLQSSDPVNNMISIPVTMTVLAPQANLELTKTVQPTQVYVGMPLTYTLTITNHGPDRAVNVPLVDILPDGVIYLGAALSTGGPANCSLAASTLTCSVQVEAGASTVVHIRVVPTAPGLMTNQAYLAYPFDTDPTDNQAAVQVQVQMGYHVLLPLVLKKE